MHACMQHRLHPGLWKTNHPDVHIHSSTREWLMSHPDTTRQDNPATDSRTFYVDLSLHGCHQTDQKCLQIGGKVAVH